MSPPPLTIVYPVPFFFFFCSTGSCFIIYVTKKIVKSICLDVKCTVFKMDVFISFDDGHDSLERLSVYNYDECVDVHTCSDAHRPGGGDSPSPEMSSFIRLSIRF